MVVFASILGYAAIVVGIVMGIWATPYFSDFERLAWSIGLIGVAFLIAALIGWAVGDEVARSRKRR